MPPATTTVHDLTPAHATPPPRPIAARLDAEPGWNALVMEHRPDGTPTGRVLFLPIRAWGVLLPDGMTAPAVVRELFKAKPGPTELIPLAASGVAFVGLPVGADRRVMDEVGFRLLCPPGESFTAAIARAEQAQLRLEALAGAAGAIEVEPAAQVIEDGPMRERGDVDVAR